MAFDKIRDKKLESAGYMTEEITKVIKTFGKREPGSEGEKKAVEYMAEQCREYGCDDVKVESFSLHPAAFFGWIYITVTIVLGALGLYFAATTLDIFWLKIISLVLVAAGVVIMLAEFIMYKEFVDKLFPKKTSYNVTAVKKPAKEVRARIFFNGHPDAAYEWPVNYYLGGRGFAAHFIIAVLGLIYFVGVIIASFFPAVQNAAGINYSLAMELGLGTLAFVPFWIGIYCLWNERVVVDGANDNLSGCYMGLAMLKALKDNNVELQHTEIGVIISGSEEAGLRGAKAWCKAHKGEYTDADTYIIAFDTIRESKFLTVNVKDLNSSVTADKELAEMFKDAADSLNIACSYGTVPFGATDSAAFNQGGFRSIGITAMDHNLKNYYHTRRDTYDNMDADCLADCFAVGVKVVENLENKIK